MSLAPATVEQTAISESSPAPADGSDLPGAALEAGAAADPPAAAPTPPTVNIYGKDVLVSDLIQHFDPECGDRCTDGMIVVRRPMPKPFKGTMPVKELCACTVRRYVSEHPPAVAGGLSRAARAVLAPARASHTSEGAKLKLKRLRDELAAQTTHLMGIRARLTDTTGEAEAELQGLADADAEMLRAAGTRGERWAAAQKRHDELVESLRAVDTLILAIDGEETIAKEAADKVRARRQVLEETIATARARAAPIEGPALKGIEKLERRISAVLIHHPELVDG